MPPTDDLPHDPQLAEFYAMLRQAVGRPSMEDAIKTIKQFSRLLASYNVRCIVGAYDGSGDSGDMNVDVQHDHPAVLRNKTSAGATDTSPTTEWCNIERFCEAIRNEPDSLITKKRLDEFLDAMFELLPGGWEINDGSYGEITVEISNGEITVQHNERITDVESSTHTY